MATVKPRAMSAIAQPSEESSCDPSSSSSQSQLQAHEQKKRRQVTVACNECRKRKVKCDGRRPLCSPCHSRDLPCFYEADPDATPIVALKRKYDQLQRHTQESAEILHMLRSRPEQEAVAILQRIRSSDLSSALATIKDGDLLIPQQALVSPMHSRHILPPLSSLTAGRTTKDWVTNTPLPSMDRAVSDPFTGSEDFLVHPHQRSRFDPKFYHNLKSDRDSHTSLPTPTAPLEQNIHNQSWSPRRRHSVPEPELYDSRLQDVRASTWTSVVVEDRLFAKIISTYLTWDHPPWKLFDEDSFINDLVTGRSAHCSKLLVNAILAYGCQNYGVFDRKTETLGSFFFVEAKQLWHLEEGTESLASIAASSLLYGLHSCQGKDKVGLSYLSQGVRMAKDMGLFRQKTASTIYDKNQPETRRARAVVAWGLFTYIVSHSMYMHREPLLKTPPPVAIPVLFQSPFSTSSLSLTRDDHWHITKTFKASCELWVIVNDFLPLYYNGVEPEDLDTRSLMQTVVQIHGRLVSWKQHLPDEVKNCQDALPHVLNLHMQYHCVMAELFRPYVGEMPQILSSIPPDFPIEAAIESMKELRHLVYQYVSRYDGPPVSFNMLGSLLCVTYAAIRRLDDSEWRFFFGVCIKFLGEMVEFFPVTGFILHGIYQSAERTQTVLPPDVLEVFDYYDGAIDTSRFHEVESSYPVDLHLSRTDIEGARLSNLINGTDDLALADD